MLLSLHYLNVVSISDCRHLYCLVFVLNWFGLHLTCKFKLGSPGRCHLNHPKLVFLHLFVKIWPVLINKLLFCHRSILNLTLLGVLRSCGYDNLSAPKVAICSPLIHVLKFELSIKLFVTSQITLDKRKKCGYFITSICLISFVYQSLFITECME